MKQIKGGEYRYKKTNNIKRLEKTFKIKPKANKYNHVVVA